MAKPQQKGNKGQGQKPSQYFNFGVGWVMDESEVLNCIVDYTKNKKANKGQGYKLFLVPVDDTGEPIAGQEIEVNKFRVKKTERDQNTPEQAPDYSCYAWK